MNLRLKPKFWPKIGLGFSLAILWIGVARADSPPNPGPRSKTEADVLFQGAADAQAHANYEDATRSLERFRKRYPSDPRFLDASLQLLKVEYIQHHYADAVSLAKEVLHQRPSNDATLEAKTFLASSYLNLKQWTEAKVTADEILKNADGSRCPDQTKAGALEIKFEVECEQHKLDDASRTYDSLKELSEKNKEKNTNLEIFQSLPDQGIRLQILKCEAQTPPSTKVAKKDAEETWMKYFSAKNLCLKEITPSFQNSPLKAGPDAWCKSHLELQKELQKSKLEKFARNKIKAELDAVSPLGNCHESTSH